MFESIDVLGVAYTLLGSTEGQKGEGKEQGGSSDRQVWDRGTSEMVHPQYNSQTRISRNASFMRCTQTHKELTNLLAYSCTDGSFALASNEDKLMLLPE